MVIERGQQQVGPIDGFGQVDRFSDKSPRSSKVPPKQSAAAHFSGDRGDGVELARALILLAGALVVVDRIEMSLLGDCEIPENPGGMC